MSDFTPPQPQSGQRMVKISMSTGEVATQKINAIKFVRHITGWGLKESKDCVESHVDSSTPYSSSSSVVFTLPTFDSNEVIKVKAVPLSVSIIDEIPSTMPTNFKGCFNMVSPTVVHVYLENGENNKLSMDVPVSKMQDVIKMFTENCI